MYLVVFHNSVYALIVDIKSSMWVLIYIYYNAVSYIYIYSSWFGNIILYV